MPECGTNWKIDSDSCRPSHHIDDRFIRLVADFKNEGNGKTITTAYVVRDPDYPGDSIAQAHLLSAAVDLKAALVGVLEVMRQCEQDGAEDSTYDAAIKAANDAIAKSEGRTRKEPG